MATDPKMRRKIMSIAINLPDWGAPRIHEAIEELVSAGEPKGLKGPVPGQRTIGDLIRKARSLPDRDKKPYLKCSWPSSFGDSEDALLPWEMAPAYFELWAYQRSRGIIDSKPERSETMLWRRVCDVCEGAPVEIRWGIYRLLRSPDPLAEPPFNDEEARIEHYISCRAWKLTPREYLEKLAAEGREAFWMSGTVPYFGEGVSIQRALDDIAMYTAAGESKEDADGSTQG